MLLVLENSGEADDARAAGDDGAHVGADGALVERLAVERSLRRGGALGPALSSPSGSGAGSRGSTRRPRRAVRDYTILSLIAVPGLVSLPRPHWVNSWTLPLTPPICRRWPALAAGAATRAATVLIAAIADILLLNSSIRGAGGRFIAFYEQG